MEDKFTKLNFMKASQDVLDFLRDLGQVGVTEDSFRANLVSLNHYHNYSAFLTIRYLVEQEKVTTIYVLSRSMFESIISMGLLSKRLVKDDLERYHDFQYIEIYKTYTHLKQLGFEKLSGVATSEVSLLCNKRNEYLRKWGRNTPTWTGKSLEHNVKLVDKAYVPTRGEEHFYEYLYCQVYRKGSPASHSSFGGLAKGVDTEEVKMDGIPLMRFKANEAHMIFSCFHSLIVFLSSIRFLGYIADNKETEDYFQEMASYIISE